MDSQKNLNYCMKAVCMVHMEPSEIQREPNQSEAVSCTDSSTDSVCRETHTSELCKSDSKQRAKVAVAST